MSKKALAIPILFIFIFIGILVFYNVILEKTPADPQWSRAIPLNVHNDFESKPFIYKDEEQSNIYYAANDKVVRLKCEQGLNCQKEDYPVSLPSYSELWAKEDQLIYIDEDQLTLFKDGENKIIEQGVSSFSPASDEVLYWKNEQLFTYNPANGKKKLLYSYEFPIIGAIKATSSDAILVSLEVSETDIGLFVLQGSTTKPITKLSLYGNESLNQLSFDMDQKTLAIIVDIFSSIQGTKTYRAYEMITPIENIQSVEKKLIEFKDDNDQTKLTDPRHIEVELVDGNPVLLFSAFGKRIAHRDGINIYEASRVEGKWLTERRSTTDKLAAEPHRLDDESIIWLRYDAKGYELFGASTNQHLVTETYKTTEADIKNGLYDSITPLFSSFFMTLFVFLWLLGPATFYLIMYFVKRDRFENNRPGWMEPTAIFIYLASQLWFFNFIYSTAKLVYPPSFLTFTGSLIVWPVLMCILSYGILKWVQDENMGLITRISYFCVINSLFMTFFIGPYLI